jgi:tetratricopeptide (TPR) repeat protein
MNTHQNPYIGPRAFRTGEKLFGRGRETAELIDLLIAERVVLMSSPSGAGKSSLINAGVIPSMREHGFTVFLPMRVSRSLPSDDVVPPETNRFVVSLLLSLEESQERDRQLQLDRLMRMTFEDYLAHRMQLDAPSDSVLVFDQFEEILTIDPSQRAAKQEFFDQVGRALRDRARWALFATREEYVAALQPYVRSIPTRLATSFRLDLLSKAAAMEAICEPAREAGVEFEPAAVEELERFLSLVRVQQPDGTTTEEPGDYIEPVQLQVVCRRLWDTLPPAATAITADHVQKVGQVERALADYYEDVVAAATRLKGGGERAVREWVEKALITPSGIRGEVMHTPKASGGLDNAVIAKLVEGYLVRADNRRGNTWYELAHDRLIEPVRTSNAEWFEKNLHPMQRQAELWDRQGKPERLLLRGPDLKAAESWARANTAFILAVEDDFLLRSAKQRTAAWVKRGTFVSFISMLLIGLLVVLEQYHATQQQTALANQHFHLAFTSAKKLLDQLDTSQKRGDITVKGAKDMLIVASEMVKGVNVKHTAETVELFVNQLWTASEINATLGDSTQAYNEAVSARDAVKLLLAAHPGNPKVMELLYNSLWRVGDAIADRDLRPATQELALKEFQEAEKLARQLVKMAPEDRRRQRNVAFVLLKIGDVRQVLHEWPSAIAFYGEALTIMQAVVAGEPANRDWQRDLANTLSRLGQARAGKGDLNTALEQYRAALKIRSELAADNRMDDVLILPSNLAISHKEIAELHAKRGDLDAALDEYRLAIGIREKLLDKDPLNTDRQSSLASLYVGEGVVLERKGNLAAALEQYRKAYKLRRELALRDRTNPVWQRNFATAGMSAADLLEAQNAAQNNVVQSQDLNEAAKLYRDAIGILLLLGPRYDRHVFRDVFHCYIKIGDILKSQNDPEGALKEYGRASRIARDSTAEDATSVQWHKKLAQSYDKIGEFLAAQERADEALEHYQTAIKFVENLAAKYPQIAALPALAERLKEKIGSPVR